MDIGSGAKRGINEFTVGGFGKALPQKEEASLMPGLPHKPPYGLMDFLHPRNLVNLAECSILAEFEAVAVFALLNGVYLRECRAHHRGQRHAPTQQVNSLREAASEYEEDDISHHEGFLDELRLILKPQPSWLEDAPDLRELVLEAAVHLLCVCEGGKKCDDGCIAVFG